MGNDQKLDEVAEDDLAGSQSSGGRILVKLKLPKMAMAAEEEPGKAAVAGEEGAELKKHYCMECDRSFSSGKALGGHMSSAHVQASRDQSMKKLKSKTKMNRRASAEGAEIVCSECGKEFLSMKALFGHMRCHPERNYRGMNSPIKPQINGENPNFPNLGIKRGLVDRNLSWCTTKKRGHGPSTEEEEVYHALIMLHRGDARPPPTNHSEENGSGSTSKKPRVSTDEEEDTEGNNNNNETESKTPLQLENGNSSRKIGAISEDEICLSMVELRNGPRIEEAQIPIPIIPISSPNPNPTPKTELGVKSSPVSPEKYTCNICNRSFPTHQALGGHRSSHRKFKMTIDNTEDRPKEVNNGVIIKKSSAAAAGGGGGSSVGSHDDGGVAETSGEKHSSLHVCKICNKGFASGQALGGHMRTHFEESSSSRSSSAGQKVVVAFDLNKMPEEEEEEDED